MASKRRIPRNFDGAVGCAGKQRFESLQVARQAAGRKKGRLVYRCEVCHGYHVGDTGSRR